MSKSSMRILTRREALLLSATAGIGKVAGEPALASDSIKTAAHQEPGNVSAVGFGPKHSLSMGLALLKGSVLKNAPESRNWVVPGLSPIRTDPRF
jgi:hypothetical protein